MQDTCDERMSYSRPNCYKIERIVEMYQHVQHKHVSGGKHKSVTYSYNDEWCWNQEKDEHFVRESEKGRNPVIEWPFKSEDI